MPSANVPAQTNTGRVMTTLTPAQIEAAIATAKRGKASAIEASSLTAILVGRDMLAELADAVIALAKERKELVNASADQNGDFYNMPRHGWTCFHCGETFTNLGSAQDHFGAPKAKPGCLIRVQYGDERGLQMDLRKAEEERDRLAKEVERLLGILRGDITESMFKAYMGAIKECINDTAPEKRDWPQRIDRNGRLLGYLIGHRDKALARWKAMARAALSEPRQHTSRGEDRRGGLGQVIDGQYLPNAFAQWRKCRRTNPERRKPEQEKGPARTGP